MQNPSAEWPNLGKEKFSLVFWFSRKLYEISNVATYFADSAFYNLTGV